MRSASPERLTAEIAAPDVPALTPLDIEALLPAARQYWLAAGAPATALDAARFTLAELPAGLAGTTVGNDITLDATAGGWGGFADPSPDSPGEYLATGQAHVFIAPDGSPAADKMDPLTVMIHELGHVLGLADAVEADGTSMAPYLSPGERRLPDAVDLAALAALTATEDPASRLIAANATRATVQPVRDEVIANPTLENPGFTNPLSGAGPATAWSTTGDVTFANGAATLKETVTA